MFMCQYYSKRMAYFLSVHSHNSSGRYVLLSSSIYKGRNVGTENEHSPGHTAAGRQSWAQPQAPELVVGISYFTISQQGGHSLTGDLVFSIY